MTKLKQFFKLLYDNKGVIAVIALAIFVFVPGTYAFYIRNQPKAYYEIGALGHPAAYDRLPSWKVDLNSVDQALGSEKLDRLLHAFGEVARLPASAYLPGRGAASGLAHEVPGREWDSGDCLFISDIEFVPLRAYAEGKQVGYKAVSEHVPTAHGSLGTPASLIKKMTPTGMSRAAYYLSTLPPDFHAAACPTTGDGPRCPIISVWAYGAIAPCKVSIFSKLFG